MKPRAGIQRTEDPQDWGQGADAVATKRLTAPRSPRRHPRRAAARTPRIGGRGPMPPRLKRLTARTGRREGTALGSSQNPQDWGQAGREPDTHTVAQARWTDQDPQDQEPMTRPRPTAVRGTTPRASPDARQSHAPRHDSRGVCLMGAAAWTAPRRPAIPRPARRGTLHPRLLLPCQEACRRSRWAEYTTPQAEQDRAERRAHSPPTVIGRFASLTTRSLQTLSPSCGGSSKPPQSAP